jgi:hypothetical protein
MNTTTVSAEIARFAEQVRAELADLSADDLDDLTDGLEADLAESLDEDPTRELPDPVAYAIELRTAAGLPPEQAPGRGLRGAVRGMTSGLRSTREQVATSLRDHPMTAGMLGFAEALRPTWWVLRAWVAYWLVAAIFGSEAGLAPHDLWWLVLLAFVVISVQLGRGRWRARGVPTLVRIGNVVAVIAVLPVLAAASSWSDGSEFVAAYEPGLSGTTLDGRPVSNIYVYGSDGEPLERVQLFDQDGNPIVPHQERDPFYPDCPDISCDEGGGFLPQEYRLESGEQALNVYPLRIMRMVYNDAGELVPAELKVQQAEKPPFLKVPKVTDAEKVE